MVLLKMYPQMGMYCIIPFRRTSKHRIAITGYLTLNSEHLPARAQALLRERDQTCTQCAFYECTDVYIPNRTRYLRTVHIIEFVQMNCGKLLQK